MSVTHEQLRARLASASAADVRAAIRAGAWTGVTSGLADGVTQANLVILPAAQAEDFRSFCERNPRPCPLLDVTAPGDPVPRVAAPDADLRSDLPRYRVWQDGALVEETADIGHWWSDDLVGFLLGCSFSFEHAFLRAGIPVRHLACGTNVPMYRTNVPCEPAGIFHGPLVVSMRPIPAALVAQASAISARYPQAHGAPVHAGDPAALGIADLATPDYGDPVPIEPGEVPVFWACGVTPQAALANARPPLAITHAPGHMFVTDLPLSADC